jgi:hypothetical protein
MSHAAPLPDAQIPECLAMLGLRPPLTLEDVKQSYMAKAMKAHPDRGGDPQEFIRLQKAFDEANEYVKFKASKIEWLASKIDAYAQQQEVATETIERGGSIDMEETDWLRRSFGEDFGHVADKLVAVRLANGRADDVFAVLLGFRSDSLKDLEVLELVGGPLTDEAQDRMAARLGADSLRYLPVESVARSIGFPADELCQACLTGRYPTPAGERLYQLALNQSRAGGPASRTYEPAAR